MLYNVRSKKTDNWVRVGVSFKEACDLLENSVNQCNNFLQTANAIERVKNLEVIDNLGSVYVIVEACGNRLSLRKLKEAF